MQELPELLEWYKEARGRGRLKSTQPWQGWLPIDSVKEVFGHDELRRCDVETFKLFDLKSWEDRSIRDPVKAGLPKGASSPARIDRLAQVRHPGVLACLCVLVTEL